MTGTVLYGINNIYSVLVGDAVYQCRIKGKVLKEAVGTYNPIAAGDRVVIEEDPHSGNEGLITGRADRRSEFVRWNKKREAPQTLAANIDLVVCVSSPVSPPFRPRFIDRVLVAAAEGNAVPLVLLNKIDQDVPREVIERLAYYEDMGYEILFSSAANGKGIRELKKRIAGKTAAFVGQSGVGKSSVLNMLLPELSLSTGEVSRKYNRGRHTTNYAVLIPTSDGAIIDTPGIREIDLFGIEAEDLASYFPDFEVFAGRCAIPQCTHLHEPECAVREAAEEGEIHPDRYESYMRMFDHLKELQKGKYE